MFFLSLLFYSNAIYSEIDTRGGTATKKYQNMMFGGIDVDLAEYTGVDK
jgi:hypothetical protein